MAIRDAVDVVVGISRRSVRDVMDVDISAELWSMTLSIYTGALGPSVVLIRSDWGLRYASRAHSRSKIMLSGSISFSMLSIMLQKSFSLFLIPEVTRSSPCLIARKDLCLLL